MPPKNYLLELTKESGKTEEYKVNIHLKLTERCISIILQQNWKKKYLHGHNNVTTNTN